MTWRYTKSGNEIQRPSSETGFCVDGPLTVDDWKVVLQDIIEEMAEQAKREAAE